ncbi:MAG TPA: nitrite reductase small subunit NirD [Cellvibrionaceae bacterium]
MTATALQETATWVQVCKTQDLVPDTGVCALVNNKQVAIFYSKRLNKLFAVDNFDPIGKANVLSRGIIGSIGGRVCVASPLYKQHFDLETGECLEDSAHRIGVYPVEDNKGVIRVSV